MYVYHPLNENPPDHFEDITTINAIDSLDDASQLDLHVNGMYYNEQKIQTLVKKLRHRGKLTLAGPDLFEISRCIMTGHLDPVDVRTLVNDGEKLYTALEIIEILKTLGLNITQKRVNHFRYCITAERP